jgi:co-chaperonin GroES (HSP10)
MKIDMFQGYVAVEKIEPEQKESAGGILIPKTVAEGPLVMGRVLSAAATFMAFSGPVDTDLHEGDTVVYEDVLGKAIEIDGTKVTMLRYADILGRVSKQ